MKIKLPRPALLGILALLLWPLLLLGPCLFGGKTFLPFDLAQFPPASVSLDATQLAEVRAGSNFDATELPVWCVPELKLARQALLDGSLPEWNPYARSGTVLLAHGADGLLYPPNWLALLCEHPENALGWLALLNYAIGALLCFGFLRETGCSHLAAVFGALCFAASGTALANGPYYMRLAPLMWLPGLLWPLLRASQRSGLARVQPLCAFAACLALTWLAGFPPYSVACTLVAFGYAAWLGIAATRRSGFQKARSYLLMVLAAAGVGLLLCAAHLLPLLSFFPDSARETAPGLQDVSRSAFDWYGFLGYLVPDLFGRPDLVDLLPYERSPLPLLLGTNVEWGTGKPLLPRFNATEFAVFASSLSVPLAVAGVVFGKERSRWFPLAALLVLWGMAKFTVPFAFLYALPGLKAVTPLRFLGPAGLMVAWLAATGLDAVRAEGRRWLPMSLSLAMLLLALLALWFANVFGSPGVFERWRLPERAAARYAHLGENGSITPEYVRNEFLAKGTGPARTDYAEQGRLRARAACMDVVPWCFLFAALLGCLGIPWRDRRWPLAASVAAVALAALQQYFHRHPWVSGIEAKHPVTTPVHEWLAQQRTQARDQGGFTVARGAREAGPMHALPPGMLAPLGIRDLNAYTYFDRWTSAAIVAVFTKDAAGKGYLEYSVPDNLLGHPLLDLLGVRYVVSVEPLEHAGTRVGPELKGPGGEFFVYERPAPLPRAFVVPELRLVPSDEAAASAVADPKFDPRAAAVVPATFPGAKAEQGEAAAAERTVRFVHERSVEVTLAVGPGPKGFLVLADSWLPGWRARLTSANGEELALLRADAGLRAVPVPAGQCEVQFSYRTPGLRPGLWLSALAAIALLAALLAAWLGSGDVRKAPAPAPVRE